MKRTFFLSVLICLLGFSSYAQFDKYFHDKTLRYDYTHCGDSKSEYFFFEKLQEEPIWAGSKVSLIDDNGYGNHFMKVYDIESKELIYSRGYCSLFNEWQHEPQAQEIQRGYRESVIMPYPKSKVLLEIYSRSKQGEMVKKMSQTIDPDDYAVVKQTRKHEVLDIYISGDVSKKIDIVLLGEGYTANQKDKFIKDCNVFAKEVFSYSPLKENKECFNIRGVWVASEDEGVSMPGENIWKNSAVGAKFYTFYSERYQMVDDFVAVRDIAGSAPYDYIYILSNTSKYGGGGIYNFYAIGSTDHPNRTGKVHAHEFGHLLLGLGDEYVGGVSSNEFYPLTVEPWEANLTTLVDFDKKKEWKNIVDKSLSIPSPVSEDNSEKIGVYEGGGYVDKGVYRPWVNCMMNNLHKIDVFCPVCQKAIKGMINFHCK